MQYYLVGFGLALHHPERGLYSHYPSDMSSNQWVLNEATAHQGGTASTLVGAATPPDNQDHGDEDDNSNKRAEEVYCPQQGLVGALLLLICIRDTISY